MTPMPAGNCLVDNPPLISIVINNYNYGDFLRRSIDSALNQNYPRVEVVVVDDGSTDGSSEIIASYGDRCIALLGENGGQGAAYNSGFRASHGEIVIFLDSDDLLYADAAAAIVAAWRPGTAKVQFMLDAIDVSERPLGHCEPNLPFVEDVLPMLLSYGYYPSPPGSGNAFARSVLERILPVDEPTWRVGSDGLVIGLAALYGPVVSIRRPLGAYRHHDRNHSEASGTNLAKIRRDLANEANREQAIKVHAAALGYRIEHGMSMRIPGHCKGRLLSLRLDPDGHAFAGDRAMRLAAAGTAACWRFPHHSLAKRIAASLAFALLTMVPRSWLVRNLETVIVARRRGALLRRLLPVQPEPPPALAPSTRWHGSPRRAIGEVRSRGSS